MICVLLKMCFEIMVPGWALSIAGALFLIKGKIQPEA